MPGACDHPGPPSAEWWRGRPAGWPEEPAGRRTRPRTDRSTEAPATGAIRRTAAPGHHGPPVAGPRPVPCRAGRARSRRGPTVSFPRRRPALQRARSEECPHRRGLTGGGRTGPARSDRPVPDRAHRTLPVPGRPRRADRPRQTGPYQTGPYRTGPYRTSPVPKRLVPGRGHARTGRSRPPAAASPHLPSAPAAGIGRTPSRASAGSPWTKGFAGTLAGPIGLGQNHHTHP